jgi:hypothetical protein
MVTCVQCSLYEDTAEGSQWHCQLTSFSGFVGNYPSSRMHSVFTALSTLVSENVGMIVANCEDPYFIVPALPGSNAHLLSSSEN